MPRRDFTKVPFAATGDVTSIPTAVQPDGSVSMAAGFGFDYQRDNGAGGGTPDPLAKSIPRDATNGILNEITASIGEIQLNGLAIWAASAAPYPINSMVRLDDKVWRSDIDNNSSQPGTDGSWINASASTPHATESVLGIAKISTQTLTDDGVDDKTIVTPLKFKRSIFKIIGFTPVQQGGGAGQGVNNKIILGLNVAESRPSIIVDSQNYGGILFTSDLTNLPFSKQFGSSQQQITNGSLVTVAHGLGSIPKLISGELVCITPENGWAAGDIQHISLSPDNDDSATVVGFASRKDAINVYARCCSSGPYGVNINTGGAAVPNAANWRLVLRAFA